MDEQFYAKELGELHQALSNDRDVQDHWDTLVTFMDRHGADVINYAVLNTLTDERDVARVTQFSNMDPTWIEYYLDQKMDMDDPHVHYLRECNHDPYRFDEAAVRRLSDQRGREVLLMAADAGLKSQLSVIAADPKGARDPIGGMTIGSSLRSPDYFSAISGKEDMLLSAALLFHNHCIGEIRREQVGARSLTARERDVMAYVALGLRTARIGERMGLADVTVEMHLRNARQKLRAATTSQAVARAMIFKEIEL